MRPIPSIIKKDFIDQQAAVEKSDQLGSGEISTRSEVLKQKTESENGNTI
jgi:hypothetical protein